MRVLYIRKWHGIPFDSFADVSAEQLAGTDFYKAFYAEFHRRYSSWLDLQQDWVRQKEAIAKFILRHPKVSPQNKVLSIGCGLGLVEKILFESGISGIQCIEPSAEAVRWLKPLLPFGQVNEGIFPDCLPEAERFDIIYLVSMEYCFDQEELVLFLKKVRSRLKSGGSCLLISHSFDTHAWSRRLGFYFWNFFKNTLDLLGLRRKGQLWGYARSIEEFQYAISEAGLVGFTHGMVLTGGETDTLWVEAKAP